MMTAREVATILKLTEKTVYAMVAAGEIPAFKVRGQWRIRGIDFDAWLTRQSQGAAAVHVPDESHQVENTEASRAIEDLTLRVPQEKLHRLFIDALGPTRVRSHSDFNTKPLEADLLTPLPQRVRVYIFNATRPPGGRPLGEHKVQLIMPGQGRNERASFDDSDGRVILFLGYCVEEEVFVLWDAGLYSNFAWSRNVQVKGETLIQAHGGQIATQSRVLRPHGGPPATEIVLAVKAERLAEAIEKRMELTRERLLQD